MKFLSLWVALHKSAIRTCMEYCCLVLAGAHSCYFEIMDKLQKQIWRNVSPPITASLEPFDHRRNLAISSLFYRYYFRRCSSELTKLIPLPYSDGGLTVILRDFMIFLSSFLDVIRMSWSTVSFLAQLAFRIFYLWYAFFCPNGFKSRTYRYLLSLGFF